MISNNDFKLKIDPTSPILNIYKKIEQKKKVYTNVSIYIDS